MSVSVCVCVCCVWWWLRLELSGTEVHPIGMLQRVCRRDKKRAQSVVLRKDACVFTFLFTVFSSSPLPQPPPSRVSENSSVN